MALFRPSKGTASFTEAGEARRWQELQEEPGEFEYEEDGFHYPFKERAGKLFWSEIERIVAYKSDLMTTDEICLDIVLEESKITYSESLPGWHQFLVRLQLAFPAIPDNWDGQIMQPPFATNYTVLFEREDRKMPNVNNFYARCWKRNPVEMSALFEKQGWEVRKTGWTEWEVTNSWSELHLTEDEEGTLLSGLVAYHPDNIVILNRLMERVGERYQYEFYDGQKNLLLEKRHP